ncbi:MAG: hypothetical protein AB7F50_03575 [Fimbriimonadaceae bacterium]
MRRIATIVLAAGLALAAYAQPVTLGYRKIFPSFPVTKGGYPVEVTIRNEGDPVRGIVYIEIEQASVSAPFELEKGARKVAVLYPSGGNPWIEAKLGAETDRGSVETTISSEAPENSALKYVVGVGDTPGILSFLPKNAWVPATCSPQDAPQRAVGYRDVEFVVLGSGAERMKDSSVAALRNYVIGGGMVIFVGGTNTPLINDPRWAGIMPVGLGRAVAVTPSAVDRAAFGIPPGRQVSIVEAPVSPGSTNVKGQDPAWFVSRRVGRGAVVFWACDPFEANNRTWARRVGIIQESIDHVRKLAFQSRPASHEPWEDNYDRQSGGDAFRLRLPDAKVVLGGLAVYGLLIVPLCLFGLNKLGRASWAWVALPLASIGFSALIGSAAQQVTRAEAAKATSGNLAFDSESESGYFTGRQEMFVPRAGPKDLRLQGVESLAPTIRQQFELPTRSPWRGVVLDIGEIIVPRLDLPPLTFREFALNQVVPRPGSLQLALVEGKLQLTNSTPWKFSPGSLTQGSVVIVTPELGPKSTVTLKGNPRRAESARFVYSAKTLDAPIGVGFLTESPAASGADVTWTLDLTGGAE